jgi:hypothetical protein
LLPSKDDILSHHNGTYKGAHRGGFISLLASLAPYIMPILGGLGAAAGVAGGIATAVNQGKQAAAVGHGMPITYDPPDTTFSSNSIGQGVW